MLNVVMLSVFILSVAMLIVVAPYLVPVVAGFEPGANPIKLFMAVIYGFCNKLECLSLDSLSSLV
jgi:hypothetical protein